jgi:hypothetical protein
VSKALAQAGRLRLNLSCRSRLLRSSRRRHRRLCRNLSSDCLESHLLDNVLENRSVDLEVNVSELLDLLREFDDQTADGVDGVQRIDERLVGVVGLEVVLDAVDPV